MYVYIRSGPGLYTVGFYGPNGRWEAESDYDSPEAAAMRVTTLNGGVLPVTPTNQQCYGLLRDIDRIINWHSMESGVPTSNDEVMKECSSAIRAWVRDVNNKGD